MNTELYDFLEDFMIQNNWENEHVPEQSRAFFTTFCFMERLEADTKTVDEILRTVYFNAAMEEIIEYDKFVRFMVEFIV